MNIKKLPLDGLLLIHNEEDIIYSESEYKINGINQLFVQENRVINFKKGTIRGMGFQEGKYSQSKLLRCLRGSILDIVVDIRKDSNTFRKWYGINLVGKDKRQIYIPKGFAHGYLTLEDDTIIEYKVDNYYSKMHDKAFKFNDAEIGIEWGICNPILSSRDINAPSFKDAVLKEF